MNLQIVDDYEGEDDFQQNQETATQQEQIAINEDIHSEAIAESQHDTLTTEMRHVLIERGIV